MSRYKGDVWLTLAYSYFLKLQFVNSIILMFLIAANRITTVETIELYRPCAEPNAAQSSCSSLHRSKSLPVTRVGSSANVRNSSQVAFKYVGTVCRVGDGLTMSLNLSDSFNYCVCLNLTQLEVA